MLFCCDGAKQNSYVDDKSEIINKSCKIKLITNDEFKPVFMCSLHKDSIKSIGNKFLEGSIKKMPGNHDIKIKKIENISKGDIDIVYDEINEERKVKVQNEEDDIDLTRVICANPSLVLYNNSDKTIGNDRFHKSVIEEFSKLHQTKRQLTNKITPKVIAVKLPRPILNSKRATSLNNIKKRQVNNNMPKDTVNQTKHVNKSFYNARREIRNEDRSKLEMPLNFSYDINQNSGSVLIPSSTSSFKFTPSIIKLDNQIKLDAQLITALARASQCSKTPCQTKKRLHITEDGMKEIKTCPSTPIKNLSPVHNKLPLNGMKVNI